MPTRLEITLPDSIATAVQDEAARQHKPVGEMAGDLIMRALGAGSGGGNPAEDNHVLLKLLRDPEPIWKDEDHPELAEGADVWVRKMRDEDLRLERDQLGSWLTGSDTET